MFTLHIVIKIQIKNSYSSYRNLNPYKILAPSTYQRPCIKTVVTRRERSVNISGSCAVSLTSIFFHMANTQSKSKLFTEFFFIYFTEFF